MHAHHLQTVVEQFQDHRITATLDCNAHYNLRPHSSSVHYIILVTKAHTKRSDDGD